MARQQLNGWCGRPLPDDRDGWRTRAFAFKDLAQEQEREVERLRRVLREIERLLGEKLQGPGLGPEELAAYGLAHAALE